MTGKVIGVIGGMGPSATVDFLEKLLRAQNVSSEADHLRTLVDINPYVPNRNNATAGHGPSPGPALAAMARGLIAQGAELLCMPCNAAHAWVDEIVAAAGDVPFVSIIDAAGEAARAAGGRPGLLAVDATLASGLYAGVLPDAVTLEPDEQARFMALVRAIKANDRGTEVAAGMQALAGRLVARGAETIVAACTEVPLVLPPRAAGVPLVDPTAALATKVVAGATEPRSFRG